MDVTNIVLLTELLAEGCAHDCSSDAGWGIVMSLSRLASAGVQSYLDISIEAHDLNELHTAVNFRHLGDW
jgi:hypothetical protein